MTGIEPGHPACSSTRQKSRRLVLAGCAAAVCGSSARVQAQASSAAPGPLPGQPTSLFSTASPGGPLPPGWHEQRIRSIEGNRFHLMPGPTGTVLRIDSSRSASSLVHRLSAGQQPTRLAWRWRTDAWPATSGAFGQKAGDDFSLRLYLMFDYPMARVPTGQALALRMARALYDPTLPAATLCYVADPRVPAGTLMASPYTGRVQVMVIRSSAQPGPWWDEDRDLGADFQQAFGAEYGPGMPPLAAVALAADTDQGGGSLSSWFSDLRWSTAR